MKKWMLKATVILKNFSKVHDNFDAREPTLEKSNGTLGADLGNDEMICGSGRLKPGDRVQLFGGFDMIPQWLCGKNEYTGTLVRFTPGQHQEPAAVIKLDAPITVDGVTGIIVILELRYVGATWKDSETVHIELCDFDPEMKPWKDRKQGVWVESHASYEILITEGSGLEI